MTIYTITEAQRQQVLNAIAIGLDCARDHAADVHEKYAGYKQHKHDAVDADVAALESAEEMLQSPQPAQCVSCAHLRDKIGYDERCSTCSRFYADHWEPKQ